VVGYLKRILRLIPDDAVLPILSGSLRGSKWIVGSGRKAFWLGIYEKHFQDVLAKELTSTSIFYDVGANVGFYSLLAARKAARVLSFEPVPRNVHFLRQNIQINRLANVEIHQLAISDSAGIESFCEAEDIASGHLGAGKLTVQTERLDSLIFERQFPVPTHIKMDIEGAEPLALKGMAQLIARSENLRMIVELAPDALRAGGFEAAEFLDQLAAAGFHLYVPSPNGMLTALSPADFMSFAQSLEKLGVLSLFCEKNPAQTEESPRPAAGMTQVLTTLGSRSPRDEV